MAKSFNRPGEKSVLSTLLGLGSRKVNASKSRAEEREDLALQAKAIAEKTPLDLKGYKNLESGPVRHEPSMEQSNKHNIVKVAGKELESFISDKVGRGGFTIEEVDFKKQASRQSMSSPNLEVIEKATVGFKVEFTTGSKSKQCFAAVKYEHAGKEGDTYTVESYFVDSEDTTKKVSASREGLNNYLSAAPKSYSFDRQLVYFDVTNADNQTYRKLPVKNVAKAKARLEAEGFEIQAKVLGRENNITGPVYELIVLPEKYAQATKVLAKEWEEVNTDLRADEKFEESKTNVPSKNTDDPKNWQDRSLEKNPGPAQKPVDAGQPKENFPTKDTPATTWDTRSLEKAPDALNVKTKGDSNEEYHENKDSKVRLDEKFEKSKGNVPTDSDPALWQDRSLEKMSPPPEAKTLLKYERKKGQLDLSTEHIEQSPEDVLTPGPEAPAEIPMSGRDIAPIGPPMGMPNGPIEEPEKGPVDQIIEMINSSELSYEELNLVEKAIEEKEEAQVGPEEHKKEEKGEEKEREEEHKEKAPKEEKEEEPEAEEKEEPKVEEAEMKKEAPEPKKMASKVQVMASTKKSAKFQCGCGSYLSTPVCDCSAPKIRALGQVTDPKVPNLASPSPDMAANNATKEESDGLDHGKTATEAAPAVVPSSEVKTQAQAEKPQSGRNPHHGNPPSADKLTTNDKPMDGLQHGKTSNEGKSTAPPHGKGKGLMDGINDANMLDMSAQNKGHTSMDGMDHGKTDDGPAKVVPSKEVPSLKAFLSGPEKKNPSVFRVSAAKKLEAMKQEIISLWDRGQITTDQAELRIAASERQAAKGDMSMGKEEVGTTSNEWFQSQKMGHEFKDYQEKDWADRSREKNPWEGTKRNVDSNDETLEKEPTKDIESWDTRSLEKNPDTTVKKLDIPQTAGEVKPKQDEAFEKAHGNTPDIKSDDPSLWQDRSLEKRTKEPNNDKMMYTE